MGCLLARLGLRMRRLGIGQYRTRQAKEMILMLSYTTATHSLIHTHLQRPLPTSLNEAQAQLYSHTSRSR